MTPPRKAPSLGVGFVVIGSELVTFTLMGVALDYVFDTSPWLVVAFTLLGFGAAIWLTMRLLNAEAAARRAGPP